MKTVVREIFLLYHLLSFVVTCHLLSLVVPPAFTLCTTRVFFINDPFSTVLSSSKFTKFSLFIQFRWVDVKNNRFFSGLSLISTILWEYCKKNVKLFWYYSYENKRKLSQKVVRLIFLKITRSVPTSMIIFILIRIYVRTS